MAKRLVTIGLFSVLLLALTLTAAASDRIVPAVESIPTRAMWLEGADLVDGSMEDITLSSDGLALVPDAEQGVYISQPLTATIPFNVLVPRWEGVALAQLSDFHFYLRSGELLEEAEWVEIRADEDMTLPEDEAITGGFYTVPDLSRTHRRLQFRIELQRSSDGQAPRLERLRLTFVDSSAAPTLEEAKAQQRALDAAEGRTATSPDGYPKPPVISRQVWCTDPACNYSDGLSYYPVSHLILHHTVASRDNSIALLQAIWGVHTFDRGWGDIGYNYLVDSQGNLYEGHLGGDNVVGTHAGGANTGSMALSMMGDFTSVTPSPAMQEAVINLFAWKADQMDIDVYDSGYLPNVDWGLPNLMGHRDVYGTTACPGDSAHPLLPAIRDEVARRIGFTPEHLYYDELSSKSHFVKSTRPGDDFWWDGPYGCGFNTHAYYTWSVTDSAKSTNWAEWRPEVPAPGLYELSVYAPFCRTNREDTAGAVYEVTHANGTTRVTINQDANLGIWVPLGRFVFAAGTAGRVRLTDLTTTDSDLGVWFDAIRLRPLEMYMPKATLQSPGGGSWLLSSGATFRWTLSEAEHVQSQSLQVASDPYFNQLVLNVPLSAASRSSNQVLTDGSYFWRIKLTTLWGDTIYSPVARFGVDTLPPNTTIGTIFRHEDGYYLVTWHGEDAGSGLVGYNIDYRLDGTAEWVRLLSDTARTGVRFVPPQPNRTYWFRSRGVDAVDRWEPLHTGAGDASTADSVLIISEVMMPFIAEE